SEEEIQQIVDIQLRSIQKMLDSNGIHMEFSPAAVKYIAKEGYDPQFGARPVKRVIQRLVLNELSKALIAGTINKTFTIKIDFNGDDLVFKNEDF
ncbi:MAG: type VI secretion system ATPase TssH, partial [Bacteroidales bacterium]